MILEKRKLMDPFKFVTVNKRLGSVAWKVKRKAGS